MMLAHGDIESVNLRTGERQRRVAGNGDSRLESCAKTWEARDLTDRVHTCARRKGHEGHCACCCGAICYSGE
jgi:hypothetical protein